MGNSCLSKPTKPSPPARKGNAPTKKVEVAIHGAKNGVQTLNEYRVLKELGTHSFGTVSLVENAQEVKMAMKTALRKLIKNSEGQLDAELAALKRLNHPHVIKLHEVIDDPKQPEIFLIYEYLGGGPVMTLDERGIGTVVGPALAKHYTIQIVDGLDHLHQNNVIHGDIRPENVLVTPDRRTVKLADFRMASLSTEEDDSINKGGGDPAFTAAEMCYGHEYYSGFACDIWALGVTLYVFLWGRIPWSCAKVPEVWEEIKSATIKYPDSESLPTKLLALLGRILERDVLRRITLNEIKHNPWLTGTALPPKKELEGTKRRIEGEDLWEELSDEDVERLDDGNKRLLIVEDVQLIRKTLLRLCQSILLGASEVEIDMVSDGDEAVSACKKKKYDLVLMDVHMSRMTGYEAAHLIREEERKKNLSNVIIVGVTADDHKDIKDACVQAGINHVVGKPVTFTILRELFAGTGFELNSTTPTHILSDGDKGANHAYTQSYEIFLRTKDPSFSSGGDLPAQPKPQRWASETALDTGGAHAAKQLGRAVSYGEVGVSSQVVSAPNKEGDKVPAPAKEEKEKDPRLASRQWMLNNRKRHTKFKFEDLEIAHCEPWALSLAMKELRKCVPYHIPSEADHRKLNSIVGKAIRRDGSQMMRVATCGVNNELRCRIDELHLAITATPGFHGFLSEVTAAALKPDAHQHKLQVYCHSDKGPRGCMEDAMCVTPHLRSLFGLPCPEGVKDDMFLGLYDGHGGKEAAEYAQHYLQQRLVTAPNYETDVKQALAHAFLDIDKSFVDVALGSRAGTTATAILIRGNTMYIANSGDARVILCSEGKAVALNKVHRPEDPEEAAKIRERGGEVYHYNGAWRVNATLTVSRSLGLSDPNIAKYVTAEPDIYEREIDPIKDEFLILATDGVWDFVDMDEMVSFVAECREQADSEAKEKAEAENEEEQDEGGEEGEEEDMYQLTVEALIDQAKEKDSTDNMSAIVLFFPKAQ